MIIHPIAIAPIGRQEGKVLIHGRIIESGFALYPPPCPESERLRRLRQQARPMVGLRQMAVRIGLLPSQLSALEAGRETLPAEEWALLLTAAEEVLTCGPT